MTKLIFTIVFISFLGACDLAFAQQQTQRREPRSIVRLLPDYKIKLTSGLEGGYGTIWKEGGPEIKFEVNIYSPHAVDSIPKDQLLWRQEQSVGKNHFVCAYTKQDELIVTVWGRFRADFRAKIHDQRDIAEFLLMAFTLEPEHGYIVDPSRIEYDKPHP